MGKDVERTGEYGQEEMKWQGGGRWEVPEEEQEQLEGLKGPEEPEKEFGSTIPVKQ